MFGFIGRYTRWLHTLWPAGIVEKLPEVKDDYSTNVPGLYIVGDLTGIPLLKFSSDSGAKAVMNILRDENFNQRRRELRGQDILDLVIVGAGVSGMAAALEAKKNGLRFELIEATEPFSTIVNFPKGKHIYTYPTDMTPAGDLQFTKDVKEPLVEEIKEETLGRGIELKIQRAEKVVNRGDYLEVIIPDGNSVKALRAVVGIGRSGNFRMLGVPGDEMDKVFNRLHDPKDFEGKNVLVVGGGDSAIETSIAIARAGGNVTHSYRNEEFSRPKPENVENIRMLMADPMADVSVETPSSERVTTSTGGFMPGEHKPGKIELLMKSRVKNIGDSEVTLIDRDGKEITIPNDAVFTMIGREAPLDFFRRSSVKIKGEVGAKGLSLMILFLLFCVFVYNWKAGGSLTMLFEENKWFPFNLPAFFGSLGGSFAEMAKTPSTLIGTMAITLEEPGFYYSLAYSTLVIIFGILRIK
ncbi:MAG: NAD(P)/FAD-dependent oxidoreductase, partial [Thermodesulfobacteriota bacterium]